MADNKLWKGAFPFVGTATIPCQHNVGGPVSASVVIDVLVWEGDVLPSYAPSPVEAAAISEAFNGDNPPSGDNPYATIADVNDHVDATGNVHSATAADIGAVATGDFTSHTGASNPHGTTAADVGAIASSEKGANNGVASLGATGKVPSSQLDISGIPSYQGTWDADSNTPTLTSSTGTDGYYYQVSVAGTTTLDGISSWAVGDQAIFNGSVWEKIPNASSVSSVNGETGAVVLDTDDIDEGSTNQYFTESRANAASDVVANTTHRGLTNNPHSVTKSQVGLGNVENIKVNLAATVDPTEDDDSGDGYAVGSIWINTSSTPDKVWMCVNSSAGAAIWKQLGSQETASQYFDGYDSVGGTAFGTGGSWNDVPITAVRKQDSATFNQAGSSPEVEILADGAFEVDYQVTCMQDGGNNRTTAQARLMIDTGSGFSLVPGSYASLYSRNISDGETSCSFSGILDLNAGDKLKIQAAVTNGSGGVETLAGGSRLTIGLHKGEKGDPGPSGAGSIVAQNSGTEVSGGPFDTINFDENLTAVDQGAGRLQVSASASGGEDPGQGFSDVEHFFFLDSTKWTSIGTVGIVAGGVGGQVLIEGAGLSQSRIESANTPFLVGASNPRVKFRIKKSGTLTDSMEIGVRSDTSNEINFTVQGTSNWFAQCQSGGSSTTQDLGVSGVTSSWQTLELVYNGTGVDFYINEVLRGTVTTNIPSAAMFIYCWCTGALDIAIDYIWSRMGLES
jgi:hypothetical protein